MEKIGKLYTKFGDNQMEVAEAEAKRKAFNEKVFNLLKNIEEKDPTASLNSDRIGDSLQAIAFTKNGRIIVHNNFNSIIIEQEGKEDLKFSSLDEDDALNAIQNIVNG